MAPSPEGRSQAWIVSSQGGSPQRLLPEDSGQDFPSWSPDGRKIIFDTGGEGSRERYIRILDVASHQITTLPGSTGKFVPIAAWSPDGQFIMAESSDVSTLYVFETKTQHWLTVYKGLHTYSWWSADGRFIYLFRYANDPAILRIPASGGEAKVVVRIGFPFVGTNSPWFGLDPTDTPLMLRDVSTSDVYALTLEEK